MAKRKQRRDEFQDISSYSSKQAYKKNQKKKKRTGLKVFLSFICVILVLVGGVMIYASTVLLGDLKTTTITKDKTELGISEGTKSEAGITNIALFGVDARDYDGGTFAGRSDAIMVMSIDNVHHKVKLTSIMRDVRVYMGDGSPYDSGYDKLNHAYMYGGPEQAIRAINQNFGLDIQDYVTVNFSAMAKIVDAFGGVNIDLTEEEVEQININMRDLAATSPDSMAGDISTYAPLSAGEGVLLNGDEAVAYGRIRAIDNDNGRVERQQEVLSALLSKASSISKLEYPSIIQQLAPLCETSLTFDKMIGLAQIALTGFDIERLSIPSDVEGYASDYCEGGGWMWTYDTDVAAQHIHEFIYEDEN